MALIPNRYTYSHFPAPTDSQSDWTEARGNMLVKRGYHSNPAKPNDEVLIESLKGIQNFNGTLIQSTEDKWSIDRHGAPPTKHTRTIHSNVWLPALGGRNNRLVQEEETNYWTFSPLAGANVQNLAKSKTVSAYVVYDQPEDPTKATDGETATKVAEADMTPGPTRDRLVHTGKLWSEANSKGTIIPEEGHNQFTQWVENVQTVDDLVDEEWDRWILVTVTKNALRPGDVQVSDPREIKKNGIKYLLPVPLEPPELECLALNDGVQCNIKGGGALLPGGRLRDEIVIVPERYKLYRATTAEPDRTGDTNMQDWWESGSEPPDRNRAVIENTSVTEFDGTATSPLPPTSGHTEPHDPLPPEPDDEIYFELIATVDNAQRDQNSGYGQGHAQHLDLDVVPGGEYEYYATCVYGSDESPHSNHEAVSYTGSEGRSYRIRTRIGVEEDVANGVLADHVDLQAPNDPDLADNDYGAVYEFEVPTTDDVNDVAKEIGDRQFAQRVAPDVIALDVLTPLLGLEWGMHIGLPNVEWTTYSDNLVLGSRTVANDYVLIGTSRELQRNPDGSWASPTTTLRLQEYPR